MLDNYLDFSDWNVFSPADAQYLYDDSPVCNGGYRRKVPSVFWIERCGITHEQIKDIRDKIASGVSCRSIVHDTTIPLNIIQWIRDGNHPDFPEKVIVPEHLKPKRGRKPKGANKVLDKYRKEFNNAQYQQIVSMLKKLLVDGETEIDIKFAAFHLPPVWWPACERTSRGGHNNNFFYPLTRTFRVVKMLKVFSERGIVDITEQEINLLHKQAKKMKEKFDVYGG